jgi:CAAX protease family protein
MDRRPGLEQLHFLALRIWGQGMTGQLENALDGLLLAAIYLACGRSLAVPIVAHGMTDTLDVLLMFAGFYPTLR